MSIQNNSTRGKPTASRLHEPGGQPLPDDPVLIRHSDRSAAGRWGAVPRILIIDHDVEATSALTSLLQAAGYGEFRVAYLGKTALALAVEYLPTLLFVEVDLPDMSGYEVARLLSQHPSLGNLRMIALTGSSDHPGRELARVAGFERYLIKPVAAAALDELMSMH